MTKEFKKLYPSFIKKTIKQDKSLELYYFTDEADAYSFAECQVAAWVKKRKPYWIVHVDTYPVWAFMENAKEEKNND